MNFNNLALVLLSNKLLNCQCAIGGVIAINNSLNYNNIKAKNA